MDDVRQRLLAAAGEIFANKGYRDARVREICRQADANVAAVNYYFGDKHRLYVETVKMASRQREAEIPLPRWDRTTPAERKLHEFVRTMLGRMLGQEPMRWESRLMLREILHPTDACRELAEEYLRPTFETLLRIVDELAPGLEPRRRRQVGFSIVGQCLLYRAAGEVVRMLTPDDEQDGYPLDELASHISSFSLAALAQEQAQWNGEGHRQAGGRGAAARQPDEERVR